MCCVDFQATHSEEKAAAVEECLREEELALALGARSVTAHGRARRDGDSRCEGAGLLDDVPFSLDKYSRRARTEAGFSSAAALEVGWRSPRAPVYAGSAKRELAAIRRDELYGIARAGPHFHDVPTVDRFHLAPILAVLVKVLALIQRARYPPMILQCAAGSKGLAPPQYAKPRSMALCTSATEGCCTRLMRASRA